MVAVLAHEVGHYKKNHVLQGMIIGFIHAGVLFFLLSVFLPIMFCIMPFHDKNTNLRRAALLRLALHPD